MASAQPLIYYKFDAAYLDGLRMHDPSIEDHFTSYFSRMLQIKLRRLSGDMERGNDIRQETFARVLTAIRVPGIIRQPGCLGAFVSTVCNNILHESFRSKKRYQPLEELSIEPQDVARNPEAAFIGMERIRDVRSAISCLPHKEKAVLVAIFFEQKDKDDICRQLGITRTHLRVLLHRAKKKLRTTYKRSMHPTSKNLLLGPASSGNS